jgi:outer membrane protein
LLFDSKERKMKKSLLAVAAVAALASGASMAQSVDNPWLVRARVVNLQPQGKDGTGLNLTVDNRVIPEVDITYFFTKNIAAELILTVPQSLTVNAGGSKLGTVDVLPPTLLLQYHFDGSANIKPYVGAGLNTTLISNVSLGTGVDTSKTSNGGALQVGVDVPINKQLSFNFDVKKVYIATDVSSNGTKLGTLNVDPLLVGVGLGWRF